MWKNIVQPDRSQKTIRCMRIECWIPKATNTHSEYVILIAFPLQQWLREHASVLRHTYIDSLVNYPQNLRLPWILRITAHTVLHII